MRQVNEEIRQMQKLRSPQDRFTVVMQVRISEKRVRTLRAHITIALRAANERRGRLSEEHGNFTGQ